MNWLTHTLYSWQFKNLIGRKPVRKVLSRGFLGFTCKQSDFFPASNHIHWHRQGPSIQYWQDLQWAWCLKHKVSLIVVFNYLMSDWLMRCAACVPVVKLLLKSKHACILTLILYVSDFNCLKEAIALKHKLLSEKLKWMEKCLNWLKFVWIIKEHHEDEGSKRHNRKYEQMNVVQRFICFRYTIKYLMNMTHSSLSILVRHRAIVADTIHSL